MALKGTGDSCASDRVYGVQITMISVASPPLT
jgi:hypothetical protein